MVYNSDSIYSESLTAQTHNFEGASGFNLNPITVGLWMFAVIVSAVFYFAGVKYSAIGIMGLWVLMVILVSPRAGIVLTLLIQVWDEEVNYRGNARAFFKR